jgi:hypothetical protein
LCFGGLSNLRKRIMTVYIPRFPPSASTTQRDTAVSALSHLRSSYMGIMGAFQALEPGSSPGDRRLITFCSPGHCGGATSFCPLREHCHLDTHFLCSGASRRQLLLSSCTLNNRTHVLLHSSRAPTSATAHPTLPPRLCLTERSLPAVGGHEHLHVEISSTFRGQ